MTRETYAVELNRPDDVERVDVVDYIKEAVDSWRGGLAPDHPCFNLGECVVYHDHVTPQPTAGFADPFIVKPDGHNLLMSEITLRDLLAGSALTGILATTPAELDYDPAVAARSAYELADAMLRARAKS
jgi:hypothetical protein